MKIVSHQTIKEIIKKVYPATRNIWLFDEFYCTASVSEFDSYLISVDKIEQDYHPTKFDCDDFALVMAAYVKMAAAASEIPHGIAFGEITVRINEWNTPIHQLNILITDQMIMRFFEPREKMFVSGENYEPFFVRI